MKTNDHIVFAGGGTAGHLFPGLAVAEEMLRHAPRLPISFVGSGKPFEAQYVTRGLRVLPARVPAVSTQGR